MRLTEYGVDVLYSCTDSIIIRESDLPMFNQLFPNAIGNRLGQFKLEMDGHQHASEAIFVKKGCYCLKYPDGSFKIRWVGKDKNEIIKQGTWSVYSDALERQE